MKRILSLGILVVLTSACSTMTTQPRDRFAEADPDHDGTLTQKEVATYLASTMFDHIDRNHDGKVTMEEWNPSNNAHDKKVFLTADTDHDGSVDLKEAIAYAEKSGQVKKFMKEADKDHDGTVSRAEAAAYYGSKEGDPR